MKTFRRTAVAGMLVLAVLVAWSPAAAPGPADTEPGVSPVEFTFCGTGLWTVPAGVTSVSADVVGAGGGSGTVLTGGTRAPGGLGGEALGTFAVTPGEVLQINVGCPGGDADANTPGAGGRGGNDDANGGTGAPGIDESAPFTASGGGGGASDIRQGGTALGNRVIVAGGGGGSGDAENGTAAAGGGGAFPVGDPGGGAPSCNGGSGGTQSGGGAGGTISGVCFVPGISATGPNGADGASNQWFASGAGGGGYNGGGSGATHVCQAPANGGGGGGGGASYFAASVTNVLSQPAVRAGVGSVVLSFVAPVIVDFAC